MKKKTINPRGANRYAWKFDLKMKLSTLFLFVSLLTMHANETYSQNTKLSLDMTEVTVKDVIRKIESLSDFKFLYNRKDVNLNRLVSVKAKKKRVSSILDKVFSNTTTEFKVVNKQIVLRKKTENQVIPITLQSSVSGKVTDTNGEPLGGVNIVEKGTTNGTTTDFDGNYEITISENATLVFSYIGFNTVEELISGRSTVDIQLSEGLQLDDVVIIGSRGKPRTDVDRPVPVDVVEAKELAATGQTDLGQQVQFTSPSFNSAKYGVNGTTNYADPASLRGLGPDQSLVLLNGKRRHQFSTLNLNVAPGLGNVVTDLNSLPSGAVKRIEVLRDGAAAQYGSDAIAGIINIALNDQNDGGTFQTTVGQHFSSPSDNASDGRFFSDGFTIKNSLNYGFKLFGKEDWIGRSK